MLQKKLNLINLIDGEILETQTRLKYLRAELANVQKSSRVSARRHSAEEKSVQANLSTDVGIQVNHRQLEPTLVQMDRSNSKSDPSDSSAQIESLKSLISSMQGLFEVQKKQLSKEKTNSREEKYLEKVKQMKENKNQLSGMNASEIATLVCEKLQSCLQIAPTTKNKVYRSVAIETSAIVEPNSTLETLNDSLFNFDTTQYLNLPDKIQHNRKQTNVIIEEPDDASVESCSKAIVPLQMNVSRNFFGEQNESEDSIPNLSACDYSQFKTLAEISSNSSTPKRTTTVSRDKTPKSLFQNDPNATLTLNSIYHSSLSPLSSIELSTIDRDAFWNQVFNTIDKV